VPHFGRMAATLSEAFIMLVAMIVAARGSFDDSRCPKRGPGLLYAFA